MSFPPSVRRWVVLTVGLLGVLAPVVGSAAVADSARVGELGTDDVAPGLLAQADAAGPGEAPRGRRGGAVHGDVVLVSSRIECDAHTDQREALAVLVGSGGAWAGRTVVLDSACLERGGLLLSPPAPGGAAVSLASGTRLVCERSDLPALRVAPGFARAGGTTTSVLAAEAGAVGPAIEGCRIDLGGEAGGRGSITAVDFGDAGGGRVDGLVVQAPHRSSALVRIGARGAVVGSTIPEPVGESGAMIEIGVHAGDQARVEGNWLELGGIGVEAAGERVHVVRNDIRSGKATSLGASAIRLRGSGANAGWNRIDLGTVGRAEGIVLAGDVQSAAHNFLELGGDGAAGIVVTGPAATVSSNGWRVAAGEDVAGVDIRVPGVGAVLTGNRGSVADGKARSWHIRYAARQLTVAGGIYSNGAFCVARDFRSPDGARAINVSVSNVRCIRQFLMGIDVPNGAMLDNNYIAWMGAYCDPTTSSSNPRGACTSDVNCGGTAACAGDSPASCTMCRSAHGYGVGADRQHHDFPAYAPTVHASVRGGLVHSGLRVGALGFQGLRFGNSRPDPETKAWPTGTLVIGEVLFYGTRMAAGIDLREIGAYTRVGTPGHPVQVVGNLFDMGRHDEPSYAIWGPAHPAARETVRGWTVLANSMGGISGELGWVKNLDWTNASFAGNQPAIGLEQPTVVWFPPSDRKVRRGDPVYIVDYDGTAVVRSAAEANTEPGAWVGLALSDRPTAGATPKLPVAVGGAAACRVSPGAPVTAGDSLGVGIGPEAGFRPVSAEAARYAIALQSGPPGGLVPCLVLGAGAHR